MYALIHNNQITETRHTLPQTWEHDGITEAPLKETRYE